MSNNSNGTSKLALLRQKRSIQKTNEDVDIEKAIDGFAMSIDTQKLMADIAQNSALVNLIIDRSYSMSGTPAAIARELNEFAMRQAGKLYETKLSITMFNSEVTSLFQNVTCKQFRISPWECYDDTNIFDAVIVAITAVQKTDANHKLHLVITDGENIHSEHSPEEVRNLIHQRIQDGEHIFLLYNNEYDNSQETSKAYAEELGIPVNNAVNFNRTGDGIKIIFQAIETLLDGLRSTGTVPKDWAKAIIAHNTNPLGVKARETKYLE